MAATRQDNVLYFTAAGDVITGQLVVAAVVIFHTTGTATVIKNGLGDIIFQIPAALPTGVYSLLQSGGGTHAWRTNGLELDAGGANITMWVFII